MLAAFCILKSFRTNAKALSIPKEKPPNFGGFLLTQFDAVKTFRTNRLFIDGDF